MARPRITVEEARKLLHPNGTIDLKPQSYDRTNRTESGIVQYQSPVGLVKPKSEIPRISVCDILQKDDEDKPAIWESSMDIPATLDTLKYFDTFTINGKKSKKKEIKESYENFDEWLTESVANIIREERENEIKIFK